MDSGKHFGCWVGDESSQAESMDTNELEMALKE
jgi:hypothetical protein